MVAQVLIMGFIFKECWLMDSSNGLKHSVPGREAMPVTDALNLR